MDTLRFSHPHTKLIAHRGCSGLETENTCAAFVAAGNRSYFGIESDVHKTADGRFVIIHDDTTGRVCAEDLSVEASKLAALRRLSLYDGNTHETRGDLCIPLLSEYLSICRRYDKVAVLELKNTFAEEDVQKILSIIRDCGMGDRIILISFQLDNLLYVRKDSHKWQIQYLVCEQSPELIPLLIRHQMDLDILESQVTEELLDAVHKVGRRVNVWTVDDVKRAEALAAMGVDYITSDICE